MGTRACLQRVVVLNLYKLSRVGLTVVGFLGRAANTRRLRNPWAKNHAAQPQQEASNGAKVVPARRCCLAVVLARKHYLFTSRDVLVDDRLRRVRSASRLTPTVMTVDPSVKRHGPTGARQIMIPLCLRAF